jgi:hypothetical protein
VRAAGNQQRGVAVLGEPAANRSAHGAGAKDDEAHGDRK